MTDLLDRPAAAATPEPEPDRPSPASPPANAAHWVIAAALLGAAAIHFAMAPSHVGESAIEGGGFLAAAWAQALLAILVLRRPTRAALAAVVGVSVALVAAWAVSRTAGLPFGEHSGHAESVSLVDGVCAALEVTAALLAAGLLLGLAPRLAGMRALGLAGVAAALVATTGAVASPSARDHAADSHGDHGMAAAGAQGHDHGTGTGSGSDHGTGSGSTEDDLGFSALSNGHQHSDDVDEPLTAEERVLLVQQLAATTPLIEKYPTLGAAEGAGWKQAGPFAPGLGIHFRAPGGYLAAGEGSIPGTNLPTPMLVFDGTGPDAPLAGFMYLDYSGTAPQGFAGANDVWHYHEQVCIVVNEAGEIETPLGADDPSITEEACSNVGGSLIDATGYMVHVWNVPGYESPDGMFTELNRKITCPDGTYHRIPSSEVGDKDTVCLNT